ncbi:PaaI family thioesterase [Gordonia terrae]|uniref:PaaI family thioesterase n=1 Tax=Gordonia terrae TaxID=2055 RepID=UPI00200A475D|nr:PaaI family thioesterase [Gordonia terrae]UPW08095.1 PaaI family thioesterase [Gordonia terrae]
MPLDGQVIEPGYGEEAGDWEPLTTSDPATAEAFDRLIDSVRRLQNSVAAARPTEAVSLAMAAELRSVAGRLDDFAVDEAHQLAGTQMDSPGRSQALVPVLSYRKQTTDRVEGTLRLGRFHLGRNGAAHGGVIPLVFDEIFGRLAGAERPRCRTANLHVDYRHITPVDTELEFTACVDRAEGRKIYVTGSLRADGTVVAEAAGLFVVLRPGQP